MPFHVFKACLMFILPHIPLKDHLYICNHSPPLRYNIDVFTVQGSDLSYRIVSIPFTNYRSVADVNISRSQRFRAMDPPAAKIGF